MVRPHDVLVQRSDPDGTGIPATVKHIGVAGPIVRLELERSDNHQTVDAEVTLEASKALALRTGDAVFLTLRKENVFDYVI